MLLLALATMATPTLLPAQEHEGGGNLLAVDPGLFFWTILIFGLLVFVIGRYAVPPLTQAVRDREAALMAAIESAKADRDAAAALLAQHKQQIDAARGEADKLIAEGRVAGEKLKSSMLEETRAQQAELLERARREIENEKDLAIRQLRAEAVDLALAGAGKVIEKNLDDAANRKLVENFLSSLNTQGR